MTVYYLNEILNRIENPLLSMMIDDLVTHDDLAAQIPILGQSGVEFSYYREGVRPSAAWIGDDGALTEESVFTRSEVVGKLRRVGGHTPIEDLVLETEEGIGALPMQLAKKASAVWNDSVMGAIWDSRFATVVTFGAGSNISASLTDARGGPGMDSGRDGPGVIRFDLASGEYSFKAPGDISFGAGVVIAASTSTWTRVASSNKGKWIEVQTGTLPIADGEAVVYFNSAAPGAGGQKFDGLISQMDPNRVVPAADPVNGDAFSLDVLNKLREYVDGRRRLAYVCNNRIHTKFRTELLAVGGLQQVEVNGQMLPAFDGIPLLRCDQIPLTEDFGSAGTTTTSVYLMSLDPEEGVSMMALNRGNPMTVEGNPLERTVLGFKVQDLGPDKEATINRWRTTWCGAPRLKDQRTFARYAGVLSA